jgi:type VI secretion system secreted protein Hcp
VGAAGVASVRPEAGQHRGINSFRFGIKNALNIGSAAGGVGAGEAVFDDLRVDRTIDKASPGFSSMCASGTHFDDVLLVLRKVAGSTPADVFVRLDFKTVGVKSIDWVGGESHEALKEVVTLDYGLMKVQYAPRDSDGKLLVPVAANWDRIRNTANWPS